MTDLLRKVFTEVKNFWREFTFKRSRSVDDEENSSGISQPKRFKRNEEAVALEGHSHSTPQGRAPIRKRNILDEITIKEMSNINEKNRLFKREDVRQRETESHELFSKSHATTSTNNWKSPLPTSFSPRSYHANTRNTSPSPASMKQMFERKKYDDLLVSILKGSPSFETPSLPVKSYFVGEVQHDKGEDTYNDIMPLMRERDEESVQTSTRVPLFFSPPYAYTLLMSSSTHQASSHSLVKNVAKSNDFSFCPWVQPNSSKKDRRSVTRRSDLNVVGTVDLTKDESHSDEISIEYERIRTETPRSNSLATNMKTEPWTDPTFCQFQLDSWLKDYDRSSQNIKYEEERKNVISEFNKKSSEVAITERLRNVLKLKEAIIDEPEIEEVPKLPELTPEMENKVIKAWSHRNPNQVLSEGFGLRICQRDLITLSQLNWLNDEVINFYMNLLMDRNKVNKFPKVYAFNTFFYPKLTTGGHASLKRWTKKVDIFDHDLIAIPVHLGVHWCMAIINFRKKSIDYYDSMGHPNQKCLSSLIQYLKDESMDKKKVPFDTSGWTLNNVKSIPMQMNGSDCGMFACMFAEYISRGASITFSQENMPYFRKKVAYEILTKQLLEFK